MLLLELFKGTGSVGSVFEKHGFKVISVDILEKYKPTIVSDIMDLDYKNLPIPDMIWASPPCNTFSKLAIASKTRNYYTLKPLKEVAVEGEKILYKTLEIIQYFKKKNPNLLFVIENPHGMMWRMPIMNKLPRELTQYDIYGFEYKKPTDFFHNFKDGLNLKNPEEHKHNRKLKGVVDVPLNQRYKIPPKLIEDIYNEFMKQYKKVSPEKVSFNKNKPITI